jgi:structural maintenance of chromosome 2
VAEARRTLGETEREEATGRAARDAWRARTREDEIKDHELQLLEGQVGSSNATQVRVPFSLVFSFSHSLSV